MNRLYVTDLINDESENSIKYRISPLSIFIFLLEWSYIPMFVMNNWLQNVVWSWDMIWNRIRMFRYGLSCLRIEPRSELSHEMDKLLSKIRRKKDETRNIWDIKYMKRGIYEMRNKWNKKYIRRVIELICFP